MLKKQIIDRMKTATYAITFSRISIDDSPIATLKKKDCLLRPSSLYSKEGEVSNDLTGLFLQYVDTKIKKKILAKKKKTN